MRSARDLVKDRERRCCARCGVYIYDGMMASVHHRKLKSRGGESTVENLVLLCGSGTTGCHGWCHANVEVAQHEGWIVHSWENPAEVPVFPTTGGAFYLSTIWKKAE